MATLQFLTNRWRFSGVRVLTFSLALVVFFLTLYILRGMEKKSLDLSAVRSTGGPSTPRPDHPGSRAVVAMTTDPLPPLSVSTELVSTTSAATNGTQPTHMEVLMKLIRSKLDYKPRELPELEHILEMDPRVFSLIPRDFLPNISNPCWYEEFSEEVQPQNRFKFQRRGDTLFRMRCLPYYFLIGQAKCGTTDLFNRVVMHPDAKFTHVKEPRWWERARIGISEGQTMKNPVPLEEYLDLYNWLGMNVQAGINGQKLGDYHPYRIITGDASPSLLWDNRAWYHLRPGTDLEPMVLIADMIHRVQRRAKILVILRDPVERMFSDYVFNKVGNRSAEEFHRRVESDLNVFQSCLSERTLRYCVYNRDLLEKRGMRIQLGIYDVFLRDWMGVFPIEQILVVRLEDYKAHLRDTMREVYSFLNLDPLTAEQEKAVVEQESYNNQEELYQTVGEMYPETRDLLTEFYQPFNQKLAGLLENPGFLWKRDST